MADKPVADRRSLSFLGAAGWTIGLRLFLSISVDLIEAARPGARADLVTITTLYALTSLVVLFVLLRIYEPTTPVRSVLAVRPCSIPGAIFATLSGAALYPAIWFIDDLITKHHPSSAEEIEALDRLFQTETTAQRIVFVVSSVLVIPICDELFFRGVVYGGLRRGRVASLAIFGASVFFAAASLDIRALPTMLMLGLLLTWFRSRSGSIVPSLLAHVAFWLVPTVFRRAEDVAFAPKWIALGVAVSAITALAATAIFSRDERALTARLLDA